MTGAYYNEIDPRAAAWLRQLIAQGHVAEGDVDERSIRDVSADDLRGYTQCHFFAGIGVWSAALRGAGWSDERGVWTGSCPCQPFSAAGAQAGSADERHLWPEFFRLIRERRPAVVFGEQVASPLGLGWLDAVSADLEGADYAFAAADLCAAGVGAPHIRQRLYFVADADARGSTTLGLRGPGEAEQGRTRRAAAGSSDARELADADDAGSQGRHGRELRERAGECAARAGGASGRAGPANGFWGGADWLNCTDGKWRAVEPGTFPLAHGAPARVGRLRGYGNAIVKPLAEEFIRAYRDVRDTV